MIGYIAGTVVTAAGAAAVAGAGYSVARGVVRGFGRLVEGDPLKAVGEVAGGIVEPFAIMGAQAMNLFVDTVNVTVYTGARLASMLSPETREMLSRLNGFEDMLPHLIVSASLPGGKDVARERFDAAFAEAVAAGKSEFVIDGVKYTAYSPKAPSAA